VTRLGTDTWSSIQGSLKIQTDGIQMQVLQLDQRKNKLEFFLNESRTAVDEAMDQRSQLSAACKYIETLFLKIDELEGFVKRVEQSTNQVEKLVEKKEQALGLERTSIFSQILNKPRPPIETTETVSINAKEFFADLSAKYPPP